MPIRLDCTVSSKGLHITGPGDLVSTIRALPVPILHGAKAIVVTPAQYNLSPSTEQPALLEKTLPHTRGLHRVRKSTLPTEERDSLGETTEQSTRDAESLPLHSPPSRTTSSHQHLSSKEASHRSTGGLSLETVSTLFPHLASDAILQWDHSQSSLKTATAPQALDPIPYQVDESTMPQAGADVRRSERNFGWSERRLTESSHAGGTKRGKAISKESGPSLTRPLSKTKDTAREVSSKPDSGLSSSAGLPRSMTSQCQQSRTIDTQFPRDLLATGSDLQKHHVPFTRPAPRTSGVCTVIVANTHPTAGDKATIVPAECQPQSAQCPQISMSIRRLRGLRSLSFLASNDSSIQTLQMGSTSPRQPPTGPQFTSLSTCDTRREQARQCRRTSAPAVLMSPGTAMRVDHATATEVDREPHKITSASVPRRGMQVDRVEREDPTQHQPDMIGSNDFLKTRHRMRPHHHLRLSCHKRKDKDIGALPLRQFDQHEERAVPTAYCNRSNVGSPTTSECASSSDVDTNTYDTPLTSPCISPVKTQSKQRHPGSRKDGFAQLDGTEDQAEKEINARIAYDEANRLRRHSTLCQASDVTTPANDDSLDGIRTPSRNSDSIDLPGQLDEHEPYVTALEAQESDHEGDDEETPLVAPSPARGPKAFPIPNREEKVSVSKRTLSCLRHPSVLLRHCEGIATPRQRQLMRGGTRTPDRFVPLRAATPTKETLFLSKAVPKLAISRRETGGRSPPPDPFGPTPRRSLRMAEQFATIRTPAPAPRQVGLRTSLVSNAESPTRRIPSAGAVWSVGGTTTTEGVASFTNGRGGRVTSSTSAPHYAADFLRRNTPSEDEVTHGRRLALAMDIDQSARMLDHSLTPSPSTGSPDSSSSGKEGRVWRNGVWENKSSSLTPTKPHRKKTKDIPTIPFRVLNAPALRDDYYCSLLAYSPTLNCLAVGLGPHVYLWSEKKRSGTNIPDSLTAPLGSAHVTSVSFSSVGGGSAILAIGRADGRITLWSPLDAEPRFDSEQPSPVSCLCFRPSTVARASVRDPSSSVQTEELLVGDEVGFVYFYSIEWPDQHHRDLFAWHGSMTLIARMTCHTQQICGIAWSPDGAFLATGGNDNNLFLFETKKILNPKKPSNPTTSVAPPPVRVRGTSQNTNQPVLSITPGQETHRHSLNAAVKALAFAPWQPTLLAAGGGSNDRCIHFFHVLSGAKLATIDCHAQVTSLVWSARRRELAATFGFAQPEHAVRVAVFSWPRCECVVRIPWVGEERALYSVAYPRGPAGGTVGSGGGGGRGELEGDGEGRPWNGRRTREEGCLVVATSDASIKFQEIWAERAGEGKRSGGGEGGLLGGSQILEGECSEELVRKGAIR